MPELFKSEEIFFPGVERKKSDSGRRRRRKKKRNRSVFRAKRVRQVLGLEDEVAEAAAVTTMTTTVAAQWVERCLRG